MNDLMVTNNSQTKISSWEKPGGTLGLVVAGGAVAGGAILLYKILPFLITLTTNILTLGMLVAVLAGIAFLISDKRFRKTVSMVYFLIMRKITGLIIEIDPIAIVEVKVKEIANYNPVSFPISRKSEAEESTTKESLSDGISISSGSSSGACASSLSMSKLMS